MKSKYILTALFLIPLVLTNTYAATKSAEDVVRDAVKQVTAKLVAEKAELEVHPERINDLINDLVVPHFDFPIISRLVLGKTTWRQADEMQKREFMKEFTTLLVRTYAKALQAYSDQEIVVRPTENNPSSNLVLVKTEISSDGSSRNTPIDYRMHISGENWKVLDLVVDGISLVNSYRGEYSSIVRKDGLNGLIAKMKEKNANVSTD